MTEALFKRDSHRKVSLVVEDVEMSLVCKVKISFSSWDEDLRERVDAFSWLIHKPVKFHHFGWQFFFSGIFKKSIIFLLCNTTEAGCSLEVTPPCHTLSFDDFKGS